MAKTSVMIIKFCLLFTERVHAKLPTSYVPTRSDKGSQKDTSKDTKRHILET